MVEPGLIGWLLLEDWIKVIGFIVVFFCAGYVVCEFVVLVKRKIFK